MIELASLAVAAVCEFVCSNLIACSYLVLSDHLAGVKVLHGLDKVVEGGAVILTLKDQNILADGDINEGEISLDLISFHVYVFSGLTRL